MFGISGEHLLVLFVVLLIFGPKRLPDLGSSLGRTLKNFKDAMNNSNAAPSVTPAESLQNNTASTALPSGASVSTVAPATAPNAVMEEAVVVQQQPRV